MYLLFVKKKHLLNDKKSISSKLNIINPKKTVFYLKFKEKLSNKKQ